MNNVLYVYFYANGDVNSPPVACCTSMKDIMNNRFMECQHNLFLFNKQVVYDVHGELLKCKSAIHNNSVFVLVSPYQTFIPENYEEAFKYFKHRCYEEYYQQAKKWQEQQLQYHLFNMGRSFNQYGGSFVQPQEKMAEQMYGNKNCVCQPPSYDNNQYPKPRSEKYEFIDVGKEEYERCKALLAGNGNNLLNYPPESDSKEKQKQPKSKGCCSCCRKKKEPEKRELEVLPCPPSATYHTTVTQQKNKNSNVRRPTKSQYVKPNRKVPCPTVAAKSQERPQAPTVKTRHRESSPVIEKPKKKKSKSCFNCACCRKSKEKKEKKQKEPPVKEEPEQLTCVGTLDASASNPRNKDFLYWDNCPRIMECCVENNTVNLANCRLKSAEEVSRSLANGSLQSKDAVPGNETLVDGISKSTYELSYQDPMKTVRNDNLENDSLEDVGESTSAKLMKLKAEERNYINQNDVQQHPPEMENNLSPEPTNEKLQTSNKYLNNSKESSSYRSARQGSKDSHGPKKFESKKLNNSAKSINYYGMSARNYSKDLKSLRGRNQSAANKSNESGATFNSQARNPRDPRDRNKFEPNKGNQARNPSHNNQRNFNKPENKRTLKNVRDSIFNDNHVVDHNRYRNKNIESRIPHNAPMSNTIPKNSDLQNTNYPSTSKDTRNRTNEVGNAANHNARGPNKTEGRNAENDSRDSIANDDEPESNRYHHKNNESRIPLKKNTVTNDRDSQNPNDSNKSVASNQYEISGSYCNDINSIRSKGRSKSRDSINNDDELESNRYINKSNESRIPVKKNTNAHHKDSQNKNDSNKSVVSNLNEINGSSCNEISSSKSKGRNKSQDSVNYYPEEDEEDFAMEESRESRSGSRKRKHSKDNASRKLSCESKERPSLDQEDDCECQPKIKRETARSSSRKKGDDNRLSGDKSDLDKNRNCCTINITAGCTPGPKDAWECSCGGPSIDVPCKAPVRAKSSYSPRRVTTSSRESIDYDDVDEESPDDSAARRPSRSSERRQHKKQSSRNVSVQVQKCHNDQDMSRSQQSYPNYVECTPHSKSRADCCKMRARGQAENNVCMSAGNQNVVCRPVSCCPRDEDYLPWDNYPKITDIEGDLKKSTAETLRSESRKTFSEAASNNTVSKISASNYNNGSNYNNASSNTLSKNSISNKNVPHNSGSQSCAVNQTVTSDAGDIVCRIECCCPQENNETMKQPCNARTAETLAASEHQRRPSNVSQGTAERQPSSYCFQLENLCDDVYIARDIGGHRNNKSFTVVPSQEKRPTVAEERSWEDDESVEERAPPRASSSSAPPVDGENKQCDEIKIIIQSCPP